MLNLPPEQRPVACWIIAGTLVFGLTFFLPENGFEGSACISKTLTDHPCPGCGVTRSMTALSHGHPRLAWGFNPLGFLIYAAVVVLTASLIPAVRRRILMPLLRLYERPSRVVWVVAVGMLVLFWISRILYGTWWDPSFVIPVRE